MKGRNSIHEDELDGALNALFLETYSRKEDEELARFCIGQDYNVVIDSKKELELLARLNGKKGGGKNIIWLILVLLAVIVSIFFFTDRGNDKKIVPSGPAPLNAPSGSAPVKIPTASIPSPETNTGNTDLKIPAASFSPITANGQTASPVVDSAPQAIPFAPAKNDPPAKETLPYFDKEGLAWFAKIKERMLDKLVRIDDLLYTKTEPGATMYRNSEVLISPFVMSNFPVTNLQYKAFLADLATQERMDDLKKCLPKEEGWTAYACPNLAKDYFEKESYNDFPVVNIEKEACILFCEWLEEQINQQLAASAPASKFKKGAKRKQVIVRLPYDYEWIYSADAAYTLIPDCSGYNTIYDATEGLVDKGFFKRTSQVNKRELRKETRMDKLSDVNRFGMTEAEMIAIYKEAMNYNFAKKSGDPSDPSSYPNNIEACCLAGHVCELIKNKDGGMAVRGCCWQSKEEYLKMTEAYKKYGSSPFIGFRVVILNAEKGNDKNPFW